MQRAAPGGPALLTLPRLHTMSYPARGEVAPTVPGEGRKPRLNVGGDDG